MLLHLSFQIFILYKNGKMGPVETIQRMEGREIKENNGWGELY
jgi:hypothetical protein